METARNTEGFGITVSYWESEEAIRNWKHHAQHQAAQQAGKRLWYQDYTLRIAKVERAYDRSSE
jgi:heme-degrading monooxygenase HmoA